MKDKNNIKKLKEKKLVRFDWAIKYILRNKANFDILEGFLSSLLKEDIKVLEVIESESNSEKNRSKFNRVDLKCKDSTGKNIIIEVQNQREADYIERILWGTSKAICESINLGEIFGNIARIISISILYHEMSQEEDIINSDYIYKGTTSLLGMHSQKQLVLHQYIKDGNILDYLSADLSGNILSENVFPIYYLIFVDKFKDIVKENIDEWIYFFKHEKVLSNFKAKGIDAANKKLDILKMTDKQRKEYENYILAIVSERSVMTNSKNEGRAEGLEEGLRKGLKEGLQKGLKEGLQKGLEEGLQKGLEEGLQKGLEEALNKLIISGIPELKAKKILGIF